VVASEQSCQSQSTKVGVESRRLGSFKIGMKPTHY
jgi:hypothetical protein